MAKLPPKLEPDPRLEANVLRRMLNTPHKPHVFVQHAGVPRNMNCDHVPSSPRGSITPNLMPLSAKSITWLSLVAKGLPPTTSTSA